MKCVLNIHTAKDDLLEFEERPFLETTLGFPRTQDCLESYTSEKPDIANGIQKTHMKCGLITGSIVNGLGQTFFIKFCIR